MLVVALTVSLECNLGHAMYTKGKYIVAALMGECGKRQSCLQIKVKAERQTTVMRQVIPVDLKVAAAVCCLAYMYKQ